MGSPKRKAGSFLHPIGDDHPKFVSAVTRAFSILRCFEFGEQHLGNQDIAQHTGLPKPTVSRMTYTLSALGYLEYSPQLEKYALGPAILSLSHVYMKSNDIVSIARPLMRELAEYTQAAVMLGTSDGRRMIVLEVCQGDATFHLKLEPGAPVPHGSSALGRADLAARPKIYFDQYMAELEQDCEPRIWPKIRAGIVRACQDYESYGFCFSLGDWNPDVFAVGAPLVSADRSRILALSCSGRISVMNRDKLIHDFGPKLVALRNNIYELTNGRF